MGKRDASKANIKKCRKDRRKEAKKVQRKLNRVKLLTAKLENRC